MDIRKYFETYNDCAGKLLAMLNELPDIPCTPEEAKTYTWDIIGNIQEIRINTMNDNKLTEELKVLETKTYDAKVDLAGELRKLNAAYDYETELLERIAKNREKIAGMQEVVRIKNKRLSGIFKEMQKKMNIFTGNFYNSI